MDGWKSSSRGTTDGLLIDFLAASRHRRRSVGRKKNGQNRTKSTRSGQRERGGGTAGLMAMDCEVGEGNWELKEKN